MKTPVKTVMKNHKVSEVQSTMRRPENNSKNQW